jgi:hypothetical protein
VAKNFRYTKQPARPEIIHKHIRARVIKELQVVGKSHVAERNEIVREWENKPKFGFEVQIKTKELWLVVKVKNPDEKVGDSWTIGQLWTSLDKTGTRPHVIKPKGKGYPLRFKWGGPGSYKPKSVRGGRFSGPGKVVGGKMVAFKQVKHPGTKPRKFTERINRELRPLFIKQAARGYRLGHQEALFRHR